MQYRARIKLAIDNKQAAEPEKAQEKKTEKKRDYLKNDHSYTLWGFDSLGTSAGTFNLRNRRGALVKDVPNIAARGGKPPEEGDKVLVGYYNSNYNDPFCIYPRRFSGADIDAPSPSGFWYNPRVGDQYGLTAGELSSLTSPPASGTLTQVYELAWDHGFRGNLRFGLSNDDTAFVLTLSFWNDFSVDPSVNRTQWVLVSINLDNYTTNWVAELGEIDPDYGFSIDDDPLYSEWSKGLVPLGEVYWLSGPGVFVFQDASYGREVRRPWAFARGDYSDSHTEYDYSTRTKILVISSTGEILETITKDFGGGRLANVTPTGRLFFDGPVVQEWELIQDGGGWDVNLIEDWRSSGTVELSRNATGGYAGVYFYNFNWYYESDEYSVQSITAEGEPVIRRRRRDIEASAMSSVAVGDAVFASTTVNSQTTDIIDDYSPGRTIAVYSVAVPHMDVRWLPGLDVLAGVRSMPSWNTAWATANGWPSSDGSWQQGGWSDSLGYMFAGPHELDNLVSSVTRTSYYEGPVACNVSSANMPVWTRSGLLIRVNGSFHDPDLGDGDPVYGGGFSGVIAPGDTGSNVSVSIHDATAEDLPLLYTVADLGTDWLNVCATASETDSGWLILANGYNIGGRLITWVKDEEGWNFTSSPLLARVVPQGDVSGIEIIPKGDTVFSVTTPSNGRLIMYRYR